MHWFTVGYRAVKSPVCVKKSLKQLMHILATNLKIIFLKSPWKINAKTLLYLIKTKIFFYIFKTIFMSFNNLKLSKIFKN